MIHNKENHHEEIIDQLMEMYDTNKNDILEKDEAHLMLKDVVNYFNKAQKKNIGIKELFELVDKNKDGQIDK